MTTTRFVAGTYNLWASARWPEREQALRSFLRDIPLDILCVQELRPATRDVLDEELSGFARVDDPFEGWVREGNIYWRTSMFDLVEHGCEDVGMLESVRRLFWVRLRVLGSDRTLFVSTAHFTWVGNAREAEDHVNVRVLQAGRTAESLARLSPEHEPLLFMGDLNESGNAIKRLRASGLRDAYTSRHTFPVATHPALPTAGGSPSVLDWQFHRGPVRAMVAEVVDYYCGDLAPSDHKPVLVAYALA